MSEVRDPLEVEFGAAPEGLRIVRQAPPAGSASFSATYIGPAGWGRDPPGREGLARLTCQLVACATRRLDRVALARCLDRAGGTLSHEASPESAELTVWGPEASREELVGLLAEVVLRPRFAPDDVARLRRQLHERQLRERTQPASRAERELLAAIFPRGHPYRETGLGTPRSVARIDSDDLRRFHRDQYTSGEAILVVTTSAPLQHVERQARRLFSGFERAKPPSIGPVRPPGGRSGERVVPLPGRSQVEVRIGGPSIGRGDPEYPAAFLANEILGGRPLLSRLFQRVRERGGLAYHASSSLEAMRLGGYWVAQAGTGSDRWRKVVPMVAEEIDRLRARPPPPGMLRTIRESAIGELPLGLETTAEAHDLAVDVAYHELPGDYWKRWPSVLRAVSGREVARAAEAAIDRRRAVTVVVGPVGGG